VATRTCTFLDSGYTINQVYNRCIGKQLTQIYSQQTSSIVYSYGVNELEKRQFMFSGLL
jgi:hypothetical protein